MVLEKQVTGYVKTAIEVTDISILSNEEYEAAKDNIPPVNDWWWLCSPGFYTYSLACVDPDGVAGDYGDLVNSICVGVRPVMRFNPESANIPTGDILRLDGFLWTAPLLPGSPKEYNKTFYPMYSNTACALLCFEDTIDKCDASDDVRHQFRCSGWNQKSIDFLKEAIGFYNKAVQNAVVKAKAAQRKNGGTET